MIGSKVVESKLNSLVISIHMGLALIQVSIMIYVCIKSWFIVNKIEFENNFDSKKKQVKDEKRKMIFVEK